MSRVSTVFGAVSLPPPLTATRVLTSWVLDPIALAVILALAAGYTVGLRRAHQTHTAMRAVSFFAGLGLFALVTMSFLGVYANVLFWVRAVQNVLLLMTVPLLLALGAPVSLLATGVSARSRERLMNVLHSRTARMLTFPAVMTVLLVGAPFLVYLTPLYEWTLRFSAVNEMMHLAFVGIGALYYWTRLGLDPTPRQDPHLVSVWITIIEVVFDGALGLVLWLGPLRAPAYYLALARHWGPDARMDQIIGAGVLWIGGDILGLPFAAALFRQWKRDDDRHAARIDDELDTQSSERGQPVPDNGLWWENDPQLAQRFHRR